MISKLASFCCSNVGFGPRRSWRARRSFSTSSSTSFARSGLIFGRSPVGFFFATGAAFLGFFGCGADHLSDEPDPRKSPPQAPTAASPRSRRRIAGLTNGSALVNASRLRRWYRSSFCAHDGSSDTEDGFDLRLFHKPHPGLMFAFLAYGLVVGGQLAAHAMWRDEMQAWGLAVQAGSLAELFQSLAYEAHPGVWHAILFLLSRVVDHPYAMQVVHFGFAAGTAFFILFRSPFPSGEKILWVAGYFFSFEYAVISRGYAVGVFFITAWLLLRDRRLTVLGAALLALAANTSLFGSMLSIALWAAALAHTRRLPRLATAILAAGLAVAVITASPAADAMPLYGSGFQPAILPLALERVLGALVPVPDFVPTFWQSLWLQVHLPRLLFDAVLLFAAGCALLVLRSRPELVVAFLLVLLAVWMIAILRPPGMRHTGHIVVLLFAGWWMLCEERKPPLAAVIPLRALLVIQALAGVVVHAVHARVPFSMSEQAAGWIAQECPTAPILVERDLIGVGLAGYLRRPVQNGTTFTTTYAPRWTRARRQGRPDAPLFDDVALSSLRATHRDALLALQADRGPLIAMSDGSSLIRVASFAGGAVRKEVYFMYVFDDGALAALAAPPPLRLP